MNQKPDLVSVIIPHLNQENQLRRCLSSLHGQTRGARSVEIIVVDNGSKALPSETCKSFDGVRLEQESIPGPGPARNKGVTAASGTILAFIDADCLAGSGWIAAIAGGLSKDSGKQILGGDVRIAIADPSRPTILEAYEIIFAYRQKEYIEKHGFSGSGNLAMRRDSFDTVGPFAGINVAEDWDWGRRARKLGLSISYLPEMIVYHPARISFAELYEKWDRHIDHSFGDYSKRPFGRLRWLFYAIGVAVSPAFEARRILTSSRVPAFRDKGLAALGLIRIRSYRFRRMVQLLFDSALIGKSRSWNRT